MRPEAEAEDQTGHVLAIRTESSVHLSCSFLIGSVWWCTCSPGFLLTSADTHLHRSVSAWGPGGEDLQGLHPSYCCPHPLLLVSTSHLVSTPLLLVSTTPPGIHPSYGFILVGSSRGAADVFV